MYMRKKEMKSDTYSSTVDSDVAVLSFALEACFRSLGSFVVSPLVRGYHDWSNSCKLSDGQPNNNNLVNRISLLERKIFHSINPTIKNNIYNFVLPLQLTPYVFFLFPPLQLMEDIHDPRAPKSRSQQRRKTSRQISYNSV